MILGGVGFTLLDASLVKINLFGAKNAMAWFKRSSDRMVFIDLKVSGDNIGRRSSRINGNTNIIKYFYSKHF